jgi:hypothetical protein
MQINDLKELVPAKLAVITSSGDVGYRLCVILAGPALPEYVLIRVAVGAGALDVNTLRIGEQYDHHGWKAFIFTLMWSNWSLLIHMNLSAVDITRRERAVAASGRGRRMRNVLPSPEFVIEATTD